MYTLTILWHDARGSKHSVWMGKSVATWKEFFQQKKCNKLSTIFEQFNENRNTN